jgi:signal transduction histidine kinase
VQRLLTPAPRLVDAALAAFCLFLTALAVKTPWAPLPLVVVAVAGVAGSLALLARRRWPVPVAAVGAAAHVLSGNPGPLLAGLFTATERSPRRLLPLLAAIGVAGFVGPEWVDDLHGGDVVSAALLTAVVMAFGGYVATRRDLIESLRDRAARVDAERRMRDDQARIGERTRIAREMHDVIAHKVALISLHAGALEVGARGEPDKVEQEAALIRSTAHEALEELRSILGLLRSGDGGDPAGAGATAGSGGPAADAASAADHLERLVESWRAAGVTVTLTDDVGAMPAPTARAVHRLVQEGLTNAHKHAPGSGVDVSVSGGRGHDVVVAVTNPTVAPDEPAPPGAGVGLIGLDERLRTVGGTLSSGVDATGVWRLEGRLPWNGNGNGAHGE